MRISPILFLAAALVGLVVVAAVGYVVLQPSRPLLADVSFSLAHITPNADGRDDATEIRYTLNRTANLSIRFTHKQSGEQFIYRDESLRPANTYRVLFSGVVDGYTRPNERIEGQVERRLVPDGDYDWLLEAIAQDNGERMQQSGTLTVAETDPRLPDLQSFDVTPQIFTPNQDGYDDRISINLYLAKPARLTVYLEGADSVPYYVAERLEGRKPDEMGARVFDYDGGVDNNTPPPPDGDYTIVAVASDAEGQRVRRTRQITIKEGGLPNAEIVAQSTGRTVTWASLPYDESYLTTAAQPGTRVPMPEGVQSTLAQITLPQSDLLLFRLTVYNYSTVPLRTIGPWPGTVYQFEQTNAAMASPESREALSGAWRVGIECERADSVYPWRWAIGDPEQLTRVQRENETLYYLMPGQQATVWGAVRMTRLIPTRNPQKCYAALIHEDVAIPPLQNRVGEIDVRLTPQ